MRRKFYELATPGPAAITGEALTRIAELYRIGRNPRPVGHAAPPGPPGARLLIESLEPWLRERFQLITQKTKLAAAIRYALSR